MTQEYHNDCDVCRRHWKPTSEQREVLASIRNLSLAEDIYESMRPTECERYLRDIPLREQD